ADLPPHRRPPYSRHAKLIAGHVLTLERRHTYVRRHTRPGARRSTLDPWIRLASSEGMGSETAVRRRLTGEETIAVYYRRVFPQLKASVVGLAGLEPAASSLSEIDGRALWYPAFSQLALLHEWHRDGMNRPHPHQTGCSRLLADPGPLRGQLMSSCLGPGPG